MSVMPRLIVALDVPTLTEAEALIERLAPLGVSFKVGYESYYGYGGAILDDLTQRGADVFLDLKLHDIPRTVGAAMMRLLRPGISLLTVHALGGEEMMRQAVQASERRAAELECAPPKILAVTILTSHDELALAELGLEGGLGENVVRLAAAARNAGCAGVVCSPHEVTDLKAFFGTDFLALCPGIRPDASNTSSDQRRSASPGAAMRAGADFLVVGRPIVKAADPVAAAEAILAEMHVGTR